MLKDFKIGKWHSLSRLIYIIPECHYRELAENLSVSILSRDGGRIDEILSVSGIEVDGPPFVCRAKLIVKMAWGKNGEIVDIRMDASRLYVFITCRLYL